MSRPSKVFDNSRRQGFANLLTSVASPDRSFTSRAHSCPRTSSLTMDYNPLGSRPKEARGAVQTKRAAFSFGRKKSDPTGEATSQGGVSGGRLGAPLQAQQPQGDLEAALPPVLVTEGFETIISDAKAPASARAYEANVGKEDLYDKSPPAPLAPAIPARSQEGDGKPSDKPSGRAQARARAMKLAAASKHLPPLVRLHPSLGARAGSAAPKGLFGSIRFPESPTADPTKFVRLSTGEARTSPADVLDLMSQTWGLELPSALISVMHSTSTRLEQGANDKNIRHALTRGIAEAMTNTQAWLTTSATVDCLANRVAGGAVTYARRVLNRSRGACVGICDYDSVLYSDRLSQSSNGDVFRYVAPPKPTSRAARRQAELQAAAAKKSGPKVRLDSAHSCLLMVDAHGGGAAFRARLERRMSSFDISGDGIRTPMVLLVIGGDVSTFQHVAAARASGRFRTCSEATSSVAALSLPCRC